MIDKITRKEKLDSLRKVAGYRPALTVGILCLSVVAALLEGIGLSFLLPIIEIARSTSDYSTSGLVSLFEIVYHSVGIPFTLQFVVLGVAIVMTTRYLVSFLVAWLKAKLQTEYVRHLQSESFYGALSAQISYFDQQGSDDILNNIVTQSRYAGQVIQRVVRLLEQGLMSLAYLGIALFLSPMFTIASGIILGGFLLGLRQLIESGYDVGDRVALANERVQQTVQAGTQGIRDVRLFGLSDELADDFDSAVDQYAESTILLNRNQAALDNFYRLASAITVFVLIYAAFRFTSLSLGGLGVFLFAMFRLAPRVSTLNSTFYELEGNLPHLVRTHSFIETLDSKTEQDGGDEIVPTPIEHVTFSDVSFSYPSSERVLFDISFQLNRGDFIAYVGPSGAGKSTIVSLLTRMYEPDSGVIKAHDVPISEFPISDWRDRVSVVRQDPYIFNDSLRYNITVGKRDVSDEELAEVCEVSQITEFIDELPNGYDTLLGDNGVKLSGGQRQRVSVARALLKEADLLVLDEATSDLDLNLERNVHQAIESMDRDYAMLVVAHRLSTVVNADRIYTMVGGEIVEQGSHESLMERGGEYSDLYTTNN